MKGSSRAIGAVELARLCGVLEEQTRPGVPADGERLFQAIEASFARVRLHLLALGESERAA